MSLEKQINTELVQALKDKAELKLSVLRMVRAALINKKVEQKMDKSQELDDQAVIAVLKSEVKKRQDSIASYREADRMDLVDKEQQEVEVIQNYLPAQMSEQALQTMIQQTIQEQGASSPADFGKVMGAVMAKTQGQADGQTVSALVKQLLSQ